MPEGGGGLARFPAAERGLFAGVQDSGILFKKTASAKYRAALRRIKGNGSIGVTTRAMHRDLDTLFDSGILSGGYRGKPFILGFLAALAAFRRVLEVLVAKELLFTGGPDKILAAVDTMNLCVLWFRRFDGFGPFGRIFRIYLRRHFPSLIH